MNKLDNEDWKFIDNHLRQIYTKIGIDVPENSDEITSFCFRDVKSAADPINWHSGDVDIAFRRFLEDKGGYNEL